jgi:inosose dehydratase
MNVKLGTAPDSWGVWFPSDHKQIPWLRYLDEAREAGYEWTELGPYGYMSTDLPTLQRELEERGLKLCGTVVMPVLEDPAVLSKVNDELNGACELLTALGAKFLVLIDDTYSDLFTGTPRAKNRLDPEAWKRLIQATVAIAEIARRRFGLHLVFHPHAETHVEYEPQIETLLAETDPKLVSLCLDTGHHAYRGGDPVGFMRKYHERIPYLHLKNVDRNLRRKVEAENIPFALAVEKGMFCEPSLGAVDFPAFRDVLEEVNYQGWAIVEQDMYPCSFDQPLPIARRTRSYLRQIGIG